MRNKKSQVKTNEIEVLKAIKAKREELRMYQGDHGNRALALECFKELVNLYASLNVNEVVIELERKAS